MKAENIDFKTTISYALPGFALASMGIPLFVHIPQFYTDVIGVDVALVGFLLLAGRAIDAFSDPIIGIWSDRTTSRFGRRRPFIAIGSVLAALALTALLIPPDATPTYSAIWLAISLSAVFIFWTMVTIPYESLAPEIVTSYDGRTRLLAWRDGLLVAGLLFASALPMIVDSVGSLGEDAADRRSRFAYMAAILAPMLIAASWIMVRNIRERQALPKPASDQRANWRVVLKNRPFVTLLASYTVSAIGSNLPATLILYYVAYVLQADNAEVYLLLYLVTGILFLPLWVKLAERTSKKAAWLIAMGINTLAFLGVFTLGAGDTTAYAILVFLSGTAMGATIALPSAMQADVVDYDELLSGERREGLYIGLWAISRKLAAAVGVGAALPILGWAGYVPNAEQTPQVVFALKVMYALVPSLFSLIAIAIALTYSIDRNEHRRVRNELDLRRVMNGQLTPETETA